MNEMLAQLARRSLDAVSTEVYEAQFQLKALPPSTTPELGTYLSYLDDIKDKVKLLSYLFLPNQPIQIFSMLTLLSFSVSLAGGF